MYRALAIAYVFGHQYCSAISDNYIFSIGKLNPNHRPDFTNTEPPFEIPPNPAWFAPGKVVGIDPWGHLAPQVFRKEFEEGKDIRPTIGE